MTPQTILCIPGNWESRESLLLALVAATDASWFMTGSILLNGEKKKHYAIDFCDRDEEMTKSFALGGRTTLISQQLLDEIEQHRHVVYITGETGSLSEAMHIAQAGYAILKAGGIGIKVDSTGKAFDKTRWMEFMENFSEHMLYEMFVTDSITDESGTVFSCGMQNLGHKDTIISGEQFQNAVQLIRIFGYYQILESPQIRHNQTFQKDAASPLFRIMDELNQPYKDHETYYNPYGMWRLISA